MTAERVNGMHLDRSFRPPQRRPVRDENETVDLHDLAAILRRRWRVVFGTLGAMVLVVGAYVFIAPSIYTANTELLIGPRPQRMPGDETAPEPLPAEGLAALVESQLRIIESQNVLGRVVTQEGLASDPEFQDKSWSLLGSRPRSEPDASPAQAFARAIKNLQHATSTKRAEKSYVIDIYVSSYDPAKSARLANAVGEAYLAEQASSRTEAEMRAAAALSAQLPGLSADLRRAELELQRYRFQHNILGNPSDSPSLANSEAVVGLRELERNLEATRTVYNSYLLRSRMAAEQAHLERVESRIISLATPPRKRSWPLRGPLLALAALGGLGLGVGLALLADQFDRRLFTRRQVEEASGLPLLAAVPTLALSDGFAHDHEGTFLRLRDAIRENVRGRSNKIVLITAGGSGEGKSMLAWNLAAVAAKDGERVFVIPVETQPAAPNRHQVSAHSAERPAPNAFGEQIGIRSLPDDANGLSLFYRRIGRASGAETLRALFADLRRQVQAFDLVLLDCGAKTDDRLLRGLASIADEILLVARVGRTNATDIERALAALRSVEDRIGGIVLNGAQAA